MTDETERLEVAREILKTKRCGMPNEVVSSSTDEAQAVSILSRRDELMKKRGAVEKLRWCINHNSEFMLRRGEEIIIAEINRLEREIEEMEGK